MLTSRLATSEGQNRQRTLENEEFGQGVTFGQKIRCMSERFGRWP